ncbi:MAG: M20/M25/M40 family metallo-hydrolase [Bacteroidetes bacterium]|nr:M20/M25/M40 family metallo-hydrolase [Bacteroidota bacterium]MBK9671005.1 M20/M25/M40 family metallo-hydrolase [Bacteroidota bacterium]MBK9798291.1 M20/M25/M40 family metallo-hydrolase [Bacteroidota bacterium]MBP6413532.1 M20/M25/M40 family metallo-hydrolase [Bacteroidia bacterium]
MKLLKEMCAIHAPSGNEVAMTEFLISYIKKHKKNWKVQPKILHGKGFQDCIVLVFGKPRTAVFAHIDSIGFTVRYGKELIKIGGPRTENGWKLVGEDSKGKIECTLKVSDDKLSYSYKRDIDRGTMLTFKPEWREDKNFVQCCYMDNRLGVWNALQLAETLENGIIAFSCWEETGGGSVEYLAKLIYEKYKVAQAIISDITWVTPGVPHGDGCVISLRDSGLPRRSYVNRIIAIAKKSKLTYQLEVEGTGGSDGNVLQRSAYPFDWCFVGAPEDFVHTPNEKVHKKDIQSMVNLYKALLKSL